MITPYDWQEGIGNRAQYIEGKLKLGSPVLAVSIEAGIVAFTMRRQTRKIFEVYDRLLFSAVVNSRTWKPSGPPPSNLPTKKATTEANKTSRFNGSSPRSAHQ